MPLSVTTARTVCHGGLSEFVTVHEVDAAAVLSHPAGDPAGSGTGALVSLAPPAVPADARGTPGTSDHDRLAARPPTP